MRRLLELGKSDMEAKRMAALTLDETVEKSFEALKADPSFDGSWNEDRAWRHIRDVTGYKDASRDAYLQQVADRVMLAVERMDPAAPAPGR